MCAKKKKMIYDSDEWLLPYKDVIDRRHKMIMDLKDRYSVDGSLSKGINNHVYYGMHRDDKGNWVFREFAPNATKIYLSVISITGSAVRPMLSSLSVAETGK